MPVGQNDRDGGDVQAIKYCNPFNFLLNGHHELSRQTFSRNPIEILLEFSESLENSEDFVKHTKTNCASRYVFSKEEPWMILSHKGFIPSKDVAEYRRQTKILKTISDVKNCECIVEAEARWREIEGKSKIPFWVSHRNSLFSMNDPTKKCDFEAFFSELVWILHLTKNFSMLNASVRPF